MEPTVLTGTDGPQRNLTTPDQKWDYGPEEEPQTSMLRVLVTGSRIWEDRQQVYQDLSDINNDTGTAGSVTLIYGKAPGLDTMAAEIGEEFGWIMEGYAAEWDVYGKNAGPIRNQRMVDSGADLCLAYPLTLDSYSGTLNCMTKAHAAGIPVYVRGELWTPQ